jgi:hypothetical protein
MREHVAIQQVFPEFFTEYLRSNSEAVGWVARHGLGFPPEAIYTAFMMRRPRGCRSRPHQFCKCPARYSHERRVATLHTGSNRVAECHDQQGASRLGNRPRIVHATTFRIVRSYPLTRLGARKWSIPILFHVENDPFIGFKSRPPRSKTLCENRGFRFLSRPPRRTGSRMRPGKGGNGVSISAPCPTASASRM